MESIFEVTENIVEREHEEDEDMLDKVAFIAKIMGIQQEVDNES